jgi:6-pyruvoyltetrahydropterin/6-carboxytetrahydropterin synthase
VPHGHNEVVTVTLRATGQRRLDGVANMVVPFETAKARWRRWIDGAVDHALQLGEGDPLIVYFRDQIVAACFMAKLNAFLADGGALRCIEVAIEETPTNGVTFAGDPNDVLPGRTAAGNRPSWWQRANSSINDFDRDGTP